MTPDQIMLVRQVMLAFATAAKDPTGVAYCSKLSFRVLGQETTQTRDLTLSGLMTAVMVIDGNVDHLKVPPLPAVN